MAGSFNKNLYCRLVLLLCTILLLMPGALPAGSLVKAVKKAEESASPVERLGAKLRPVTVEETRKYNLDDGRGLTIVWLDVDGPLGKAGFEMGDIILEINGQAIDDLNRFIDRVSAMKPHELTTLHALDHRSGQTGYVQIGL
jgi:S1-C subfamily serine protease